MPEGVTKVNGATPSSRAPAMTYSRRVAMSSGSCSSKNSPVSTASDVVVGPGAEVERNHRRGCSTTRRGRVDRTGERLERRRLLRTDARRSMSASAASTSRRRHRLRIPAVHVRGRAVVVDALGDAPREQAGADVADPALTRHRVGRSYASSCGFLAREEEHRADLLDRDPQLALEHDRVGARASGRSRRSRGSARFRARRSAARRRRARCARPGPTRCRRSPRARCRRSSGRSVSPSR